MSRENVEVVRQGLEAWQRDDLDAFVSHFDPGIEWYAVFERLLGGEETCYRGVDGLRRMWSVYRTEFADFEVWADDLRPADDDRVVLLGHLRWRGPTSGIQTESALGQVMTLRDGKVVHSMDYLSHQEALEAVGLRE